MGSVREGPASQADLRGLVEVFLLTQPIPDQLKPTLTWIITDYCDVVCGSGMLAVPNTYYETVDGPHWDLVVSTTVRYCSLDLTLSYRGHKLGLWYRNNSTQPIIIANPDVLDGEACYRVRLPQCHGQQILNRTQTKTTLTSPVSRVLLSS